MSGWGPWWALLTVPALLALPRPAARRQDGPPAPPQPAAVESRPNLLLVVMDTTRADHLGCYGYPRPTTPHLDALARESIVFEQCHTVLTHTTPSHASLFTGVEPMAHGVLACSFRSPENVQESRALVSTAGFRTVAELLQSSGWDTGGFVTAATTKRITGLAAGFTAWGEPDGEVRPGAEARDEALAWLADAREPFFLWTHFFDAHAPPREDNRVHLETFAPDEAMRRHMAERRIGAPPSGAPARAPAGRVAELEREIARYDAGIRLIDDHFAAIRAALVARGAWERTTVVVVADHGEGLGQHNFPLHGPVWREGTHVPFLLRVPGRAPERVATVVSLIDVFPTALSAVPGFPAAEFLAQAHGRDVLAPDFAERAVFSMSPPNRGELALTTANWKWIRRTRGKHALYDIAKDPHEFTDVAAKHPDVAAGLDRQLLERVREQRARNLEIYSGERHGGRLSKEAEEQLRAELAKLGYVEEEAGTADGDADAAADDGSEEERH